MHVCLLTWHSWYSVKFRNCISGCVQTTKIVHIGLAYTSVEHDHDVQDSCSNWGDGQSIFQSISEASKARLFEVFFPDIYLKAIERSMHISRLRYFLIIVVAIHYSLQCTDDTSPIHVCFYAITLFILSFFFICVEWFIYYWLCYVFVLCIPVFEITTVK